VDPLSNGGFDLQCICFQCNNEPLLCGVAVIFVLQQPARI
jgi:hypothetical protein